MIASKRDWLLLAFRAGPLDRIHLMEALFLTWNRSERNIPNFFRFEESESYGPCSQEFYSVLEELCREGLIVKASQEDRGRAKYRLTVKGRLAAEQAAQDAERDALGRLDTVIEEVCQLDVYTLIQKVNSEAQDSTPSHESQDAIRQQPDEGTPGEQWRALRF